MPMEKVVTESVFRNFLRDLAKDISERARNENQNDVSSALHSLADAIESFDTDWLFSDLRY